MTAPVWQAGRLYQPGDLVRRVSAPPASSAAVPNAGFESGDNAWVKNNVTIVSDSRAYAGGWCARFVYAGGANGHVRMAVPVAIEPGQAINGWCFIRIVAGASVSADVNLVWLDASQTVIATTQGNLITVAGSAYVKSQVAGVAPANAAYCYLQGDASAQSTNAEILFDQFGWDYVPPVSSTLIYKAVQATAGYSGSTEPTWPAVLGQTVVDNQVTWEAVNTSRVVWRAESLMKSGGTEPTWPTTPGAFVSDGTVSWECVSRVIEDAKCPHSKVVAIASGKVFAADKDIVRFSATANPLDWSSEQDAGYLPTGLQQANANDMAVLALYRGNLAAFNASSFQMWQVDPDPQAMALLDQMEGIGSTWQGAAQAVGNDLLFLSQLGVRSVGIAGASTNLQAGDIGMPVDMLIQDAIRASDANGTKAVSTYYPSAGQYWLLFSDYPPPSLAITGNAPNATLNAAYSYTYTATGGMSPRTFSLLSGALPSGLTLSSSGTISGTTSATGNYSWVVRVTDANGATADLSDNAQIVEYLSTTDAYFIGGIRRLVSGYNGPAILVKRSSDNAALDIGFAAGSRDLDWAALASFVGTSTGYVVGIYKQAGSCPDTISINGGPELPVIRANGTNYGHIRWGNTGDTFILSGPNARKGDLTVCMKAGVPSGNSARYLFCASGATSPYTFTNAWSFGWQSDFPSDLTITNGSFESTATIADRNRYDNDGLTDGSTVVAVWDVDASIYNRARLYVNGIEPPRLASQHNTGTYTSQGNFYIAGHSTDYSPCALRLETIAIYLSALSDAERNLVELVL